jgi:hypothetical protein
MIWILILSLFILFLNLKEYKSLFRTSKEAEKSLRDRVKKNKDEFEAWSLFAVVVAILYCIPYFIFYGVAADILKDYQLLLLWIALQIVLTIVSLKNAIMFFLDENRNIKENILQKICHPLDTVFIAYFIYYCVNHL